MSSPYRDTMVLTKDIHTKLIDAEDCECLFFTIDELAKPGYKRLFKDSTYLWRRSSGEVDYGGSSGKYDAQKFIINNADKGYLIEDTFVPIHRIDRVEFVCITYKKLLTLKKEE